MKQTLLIIGCLLICGSQIFAQVNTIDPSLTPKQDASLNSQADAILELVTGVLEGFPPQKSEPLQRTEALCLLDCIFHDVYAPQRLPVQQFVQARAEKMAGQLEKEGVSEGARIWKLYSHSFVVRTKSVTIGFDLIRPSVRFDSFYMDMKPVLKRIVDQCDILFVSHFHGDHADAWVANQFIKQGKPVITSPDVWKDKVIYNSIMHLDRNPDQVHKIPVQGGKKELRAMIYPGHQGDILNNVPVVYTPEGLCFSHNGDQNSGQVENDTVWLFNIYKQHDIDVLLYNSYMRPDWIKGFDPKLVISGHENELGHGIHSRHPYWKMHERMKPIPYPVVVMAWGESFHYKLD
jgi:L-ascorbate metabolism protein UlaG (beta-lactamase superfamily)